MKKEYTHQSPKKWTFFSEGRKLKSNINMRIFHMTIFLKLFISCEEEGGGEENVLKIVYNEIDIG